MSTLKESLTLVVPTYNRHEQIPRLNEFARVVDVGIIVVDGTRIGYNGKCDSLRYLHMPSLEGEQNFPQGSFLRRLALAFSLVETPYSSLMADDELYSPRSLINCIEFLEIHPEYIACRGECYGLKSTEKGIIKYRQYPEISRYNVQALEPQLRLYLHFSDYTPSYVYSVTKSFVQKRFFTAIEKFAFVPVFAWMELFYEAYAAALGPCMVLAEPYQLRGNCKKIPRLSPVENITKYFQREEGYLVCADIADSLSVSIATPSCRLPSSVTSSQIRHTLLFAIATYVKNYTPGLVSYVSLLPSPFMGVAKKIKKLLAKAPVEMLRRLYQRLRSPVQDPQLINLSVDKAIALLNRTTP